MIDDCTQSCNPDKQQNKHRCPVNGREYDEVSVKTILHHVKQPWSWKEKRQRYYFCDDPECDVVYFGQDDSMVCKSSVRTPVGIKEKSDDALVCYCFDVTASAATAYPATKAFVIEKTREHLCECEVCNPSGKCCLNEFPKSYPQPS